MILLFDALSIVDSRKSSAKMIFGTAVAVGLYESQVLRRAIVLG